MAECPEPAAEILRREWERERCPAALAHNARGIFTRLRTMTAADFAALPDCGEGLEHRLVRAAQASTTLEECYAQVKSKRYAHARVRRLILWAYLGLTAADCPEQPPYLRVLGLTEDGRGVLRRAKELGALPIVTKPAAVKALDTGASGSSPSMSGRKPSGSCVCPSWRPAPTSARHPHRDQKS